MKNVKISMNQQHRGIMHAPEIVDKMLYLASMGWGKKKIARELGTTPKTVRRYLRIKGWQPYQRKFTHKKLDGLNGWLTEAFRAHRGNAIVLHQELLQKHNISVHPRTVQRAVSPLRRQLIQEAIATVRFETPPGKQMQIDFGSMNVKIGGEAVRVYFFAATLGYSRRQYVHAFTHERQSAWFAGIEGAFRYFGGIPEQLLLDNASSLVTKHNPMTREVLFNPKFHAFSRYWGFCPKACAPCRARTKGKDESTVKYIKRNAIAGREFVSWGALEEHLRWWMTMIADERIHGTTGEKPIERFHRDEHGRLKPLDGRPPFMQLREMQRVVHVDSMIEVDKNFYSVPWQLIKEQVVVQCTESEVIVTHGSEVKARHPIASGTRERVINSEHLKGIIGSKKHSEGTGDLLRPLAEYAAVVGGEAW